MKKYRAYWIFSASKYLGEFEANSKEEAEDMASASENNYASLCHQCSREIELDDSSAYAIQVEEVEE